MKSTNLYFYIVPKIYRKQLITITHYMYLGKRLQLNDNQCSVCAIGSSTNSLPFCRTNVGIFMLLYRCEQSGDFSPPDAGPIIVLCALFSLPFDSYDE